VLAIQEWGIEGAAKQLDVSEDSVKEALAHCQYRWDFDTFAKDRLWVSNKRGQVVRFIQNGPQKMMDAAIMRQVIAGSPVRLALLKARQWGGSTKGQGYISRDTFLHPNRSSMTIAHDLDSARHLRGMSERFYDRYEHEKPRRKKESDKWWKFIHTAGGRPAESSIRIDTADELSGGHSYTLQNLHCSEVQLWRNPQELIKGLFPTVPPHAGTFIFMEGTGSGIGNYWYEFLQMAMNKEQDEWEFIFIPWFDIEDYSRRFRESSAKVQFERELDIEEKLLRDQGVTLEQLHWRRNEIRNVYKGDYDAFHQQYPATPDEAFVTSGRHVFPISTVRERVSKSRKPLKVGNLKFKREKDQIKGVVWEDDEYGLWNVWEEKPKVSPNRYCIGADSAEGIEVVPELGSRGGDFSVARVLNREERKFVATLRSRIDTDQFEEELWKAGIYWGAPLFPERNGETGGALIRGLKDRPGIRILRTPQLGKRREEKKDAYGWETQKHTRRILIDDLKEAVRENDYYDPDEEVWKEFLTFIFDEKGKPQAQDRKWDDCVMATGITLQADILLPGYRVPLVERKKTLTADMDVPEVIKWRKDTYRPDGVTRRQVFNETYSEI
jgi:hypothetical protein